MAQAKTNVQRVLERAKIAYTAHSYDVSDGVLDGVTAANRIGMPVERVFKTLVTRGASGRYFVFVIPVAQELDLKAAARAVGEKSIAMIAQKELLPLTGYIHGGCSPIGMKKQFPTVIDESAEGLSTIGVSAGHIGMQAELSPKELARLIDAKFAPLTRQPG